MSDKDVVIPDKAVEAVGLQVLQHSLGVDQYGRGQQYRNRFVTGQESTDWPTCQALVEADLMVDRGAVSMYGGMHYFEVTKAGKAYVAQHSPAPPKLTRSQKRYLDYLNADSGMTFKEWMTRGWTA